MICVGKRDAISKMTKNKGIRKVYVYEFLCSPCVSPFKEVTHILLLLYIDIVHILIKKHKS